MVNQVAPAGEIPLDDARVTMMLTHLCTLNRIPVPAVNAGDVARRNLSLCERLARRHSRGTVIGCTARDQALAAALNTGYASLLAERGVRG